MKYSELKDTIVEMVSNDKIYKKGMIIEYRLPEKEFDSIYKMFIQDVGGEFKEGLSEFEIESDYGLVFKITKDE